METDSLVKRKRWLDTDILALGLEEGTRDEEIIRKRRSGN
jgi:hypothetical protein